MVFKQLVFTNTNRKVYGQLKHIQFITNNNKTSVIVVLLLKGRKFTLQRRFYLAWYSCSPFPISCSLSISSSSPPLPPSCLLINDRSTVKREHVCLSGLSGPEYAELFLAWRLPLSACGARSAFQVRLLSRATLVEMGFWQNEGLELQRSLM